MKRLKEFMSTGHAPTLLMSFLHFDVCFMVWVLIGVLGVSIAQAFGLSPAQKGLLVAIPILGGALARIPLGILTDRIGPKKTGLLMLGIVAIPLLGIWLAGTTLAGMQALALLLGVAGGSFAVALPLASRWYPARHQGLAMGIAGAGNSGTVLAALFAPRLAERFGWHNVFGLALIPLACLAILFAVFAKDSPAQPKSKPLRNYLAIWRHRDTLWFSLLYSFTFGGFVGLASFLVIFFHDQYGLDKVTAGSFTALCVFSGSFLRPVGGYLADRLGGTRMLMVLFLSASTGLLLLSTLPPLWAATVLLFGVMASLGMGNGSVFQLVPQRFGDEIGVATGVVGAAGGLGGFLLPAGLGMAKGATGSFAFGWLCFSLVGLACLLLLRKITHRWHLTWLSDPAPARMPSRASSVATVLLISAAVFSGAAPARADGPAPMSSTITAAAAAPVDGLEARVAALEAAQKSAPMAAVVVAGKDGFALKSADGDWVFKPWGYLQFDGRVYRDDTVKPLPNTLVMRRARIGFDLNLGHDIGGRLLPDFGNGTTVLYDAWIDYKHFPWLALRAGKFKPPFGYERLQTDTTMLFIERALPSNLTPDRDLGAQASGDLGGGLVTYAVGIFNGVPDAGNVDTDPDDDKDGAARVYVQPFKTTGMTWFRELGVGAGGTYGHRAGSAATPELPVFKTVAQQTWFSYKSTAVAKGRTRRATPQAGWYAGPVGIFAEYVRTEEEVAPSVTSPRTIVHDEAWQTAGSIVLTGEHPTYKGLVPARPLGSGGCGAVELVGRVNELKADPKVFPTLADPTVSARVARGWAAGVNWYLTANLRCLVDYEETRFRGGALKGADREREKVILGRVQLAF